MIFMVYFFFDGSDKYFCRIIYGYFEMAAKEGDMAGLKGMVLG